MLVAACSGGGSRGTPIPTLDVEAELVVCRAERDAPTRGTMRLTTRRGLGDKRLADAAGVESGVRVHPDGVQLVFVRQRRGTDVSSREIYTGFVDGSAVERRLTTNAARDDSPCWTGDGQRIAFSSDRSGGRRIWTMRPDGTEPDILFDDGSEQTDPDANGDLIVYSRWDPLERSPRRTLWLFDTVALNALPLTDGGSGSSTDVPGDSDPAFSPDGTTILFTRSTSDGHRRLMRVDRLSGVTQPLGDGSGDDRWPRWSPHGDAIFVARSRPDDGHEGLRLFELDADGSDPVAILPDERFEYPGFDVLPALGPRPATGSPTTIDIDRVDGTIAFGTGSIGTIRALEDADGVPISVLTGFFDDRQLAGLRLTIPLGADDPESLARIDVSVRASVGRADGDSIVRLTLRNPAENRNDTILERPPAGTGLVDYAFTTQGLQNVDRDGNLELTIIADLPDGDRVDLSVDQLVVTVTTDA